MGSSENQKIFCYVDETGQDTGAAFFLVVAVVSAGEQYSLREELLRIEAESGIGQRKWHKARGERRLRYLNLVLRRNLLPEGVFFGSYRKPTPFFFPYLEVIERAIKAKAGGRYAARVYVDGIDRLKAAELTNALRDRGVILEMVKSRRDESEPLIRLADRWAGCLRAALQGSTLEKGIVQEGLDLRRIVGIHQAF